MVINHNIAALNSYRQLSANAGAQQKSLEKLSSGQRINRAGDDAAGLAISEKMRGQIRGLEQASRNAQDGISMIQTAEGGLNETHSILQRMRELAVQASNDTLSTDDRGAISTEIGQLKSEIDRIGTTTKFNTKSLLDGSLGMKVDETNSTLDGVAGLASVGGIDVTGAAAGSYSVTTVLSAHTVTVTDIASGNSETKVVSDGAQELKFDSMGIALKTTSAFTASTNSFGSTTIIASGNSTNFQIGADSNQQMSISIGNMKASALGVNALDVSSYTTANAAIDSIDNAIKQVSTQRATLGAYQNRLEHSINNLNASDENLTASESRIRDVDMAKEMMNYTKNNILQQAATSMLAQANQAPQGVLSLLR